MISNKVREHLTLVNLKRTGIRMKKIITLLLALVLLLSTLAGCGSSPVSLPVVNDDSVEQQEDWTTPESEKDGEQVNEPEKENQQEEKQEPSSAETYNGLSEDGSYDSKEDVARYINIFGHLPKNYITKKEAQSLGWSGGSLEPYAPGCCIGGSHFGNYEGILPEADGRSYTECDIDTQGKSSRGAKRLVYSNDGLIFYTDDHYETFELLYGEADG